MALRPLLPFILLPALIAALFACGGASGRPAPTNTRPAVSATRVPALTASPTQPASPIEGTAIVPARTPGTSAPTERREYDAAFTLTADPGNNRALVERSGPMPASLKVVLTGDSIQITGNAPFIAVTGTVEPDGSFTASGLGRIPFSVAIIDAAFAGTLSGDSLSGSYLLGGQQPLPNAQTMTYSVTGRLRP